jgi:di/tricarboxylate transporter
MTTPQLLLFAILGALFVLLAWGRWRYDVVAFSALMAAVIGGLVPTREAFAGFSHPATITVVAVLIISRALTMSGAVDWVTRAIAPAAARTWSHVGALSGVAAVMSAFMNNVGALGLLMPVALQSARKAGRSPATILMPLSFGSILGGLVTLIGTPPNIIIAAYRGDVAEAPFGMFDFAPVGAVTAIAGLIFVATIGWRLVPAAASTRAASEALFDIEGYIAEAKVPKGSDAYGKTLAEIEKMTKDIDVLIVGIVRRKRLYRRPSRSEPLKTTDRLVIEAGPQEIGQFASRLGLELAAHKGSRKSPLTTEGNTLVEAVVAPRSRLDGQAVENQRLIGRYGFTVLAVARQGTPYRGRLGSLRLRVGDVLLLLGDAERAPEALAAFGALPLAERGISHGNRRDALALIAIFAAAIVASSLGLLPTVVALCLAAVAMVVVGLVSVRGLYESVEWPVVVLLGSLIPVGGALQTTGATNVIATAIHTLTLGGSAVLILALLMVVTMTLSDILNNAATAVVMAPIAVGVARRLDVNADPFLMAVAVAASCAFLTPIGHQNNALVMGPGGYRFGDYWRMGLPLEILIVAVSIPMILWVWPL